MENICICRMAGAFIMLSGMEKVLIYSDLPQNLNYSQGRRISGGCSTGTPIPLLTKKVGEWRYEQNALKKVNEELINMYWRVGEYLSKESVKASFGDDKDDLPAARMAKSLRISLPIFDGVLTLIKEHPDWDDRMVADQASWR